VEALFRQLGVWKEIEDAGFIRHPGHRVKWAGEVQFSSFGGPAEDPWRGFQAWRPVLDAILLDRARQCGTKVMLPCEALSPIQHDGRVHGVITKEGEIRARHVVDCTGRASWLNRRSGWEIQRRTRPLIAGYGYCLTNEAEKWFVPELEGSKAGWTWIAQVLPDVVAWTRVAFHGDSRLPPTGLEPTSAVGSVAMKGSSADVGWRSAKTPAGPGYFIAGDAAFVVDPLSSHGVLRALMSGIHASHLIAKIRFEGFPESRAASLHTEWLSGWFENEMQSLSGFYARLGIRLPDGA